MIVKVLGGIDILSAFVFLMFIFSLSPWVQIILFCAGLLFLKGLFILSGDVLSIIDLISSLILVLALFVTLSTAILWIPALLLLAKGFVSFL